MRTNCKHLIRPPGSDDHYRKHPERECKRKVWDKYPDDGYCPQHHWDTIESALLSEIASNTKRSKQLKQQRVGLWIQRYYPVDFVRFLKEIDDWNDLRDKEVKKAFPSEITHSGCKYIRADKVTSRNDLPTKD